jgi:eukaryotic-like serine/threonine-protein kinase
VTNPTKIGRYEIIERVGRGGMGVLYRGRDTVLEREVAIKVMAADFDSDSDDTARPRFYREARAAAKLQHRNIVTIFEFGEEEHTPFIVMEFLRGQDLSHRMRAEPPLAVEEKLDIVADLCTGLHFAHEQGVVHRDVKPANIWIQQDGSIKLLDFGIAKFASSTMTRQGSVFGSVSYMSPEQVTGSDVDGRADIFSAGVVLFELLTGKKPFDGDSPTAVLARIMDDRPVSVEALGPDVPKPLAAAVAKALQKDRDKRYRHAADFGADLRLVRSALSAVEPLTMDIELTRAAANSDLGATVVTDAAPPGDPAGAVSLQGIAAHDVAPRGAAPRAPAAATRPTWLPVAVAGGVIGVLALLFVLLRGGSTPRSAPSQPVAQAPAGAQAGASVAAARPAEQKAPPVVPERQRTRAVVQPPAGPGGARPQVVPPQTAPAAPPPAAPAEPESAPVRPGRTVEPGRLQLRAAEGCSVSIDDRDFGEPPYPPDGIPFPAGSHTAKLNCGGTVVRSVTFRIAAGEMLRLQIVR